MHNPHKAHTSFNTSFQAFLWICQLEARGAENSNRYICSECHRILDAKSTFSFKKKVQFLNVFLFLPACSSGCLLSKISIFTATVNVAISKISSVTNITTLVPYLVRILGGPLPRCSNNLLLMPILK